MAVSVDILHRDKVGNAWLNLVEFTMDSSYPTGGESITPNQVGMSRIIDIFIETEGNYIPKWDRSAEKIVVLGSPIGMAIHLATRADFTDNGDDTGYVDFTQTIPVGAIPLGFKAVTLQGFTGDTSATIQVGVPTDLDRFSADTSGSVFTTNAEVASLAVAADAAKGVNAVVTPRITITSASDFTDVSAGSVLCVVFYISPNAGPNSIVEIPNGINLSTVKFRGLVLGT